MSTGGTEFLFGSELISRNRLVDKCSLKTETFIEAQSTARASRRVDHYSGRAFFSDRFSCVP